MKKAERVARVLEAVDTLFPDAECELIHHNAFELLIAVVLSAQTTDKSVNQVTPVLFQKYPTPEALANASLEDLEQSLKRIGLYRNKAKNVKRLSQELVERFDGHVPQTREELTSLPGVGRKTANVVLSDAFGVPALAVDTHVERVSKRLKLAKKEDSVLDVERKLCREIPRTRWTRTHHQLIFFGRYFCKATAPSCADCPLFDICTEPLRLKRRPIEV